MIPSDVCKECAKSGAVAGHRPKVSLFVYRPTEGAGAFACDCDIRQSIDYCEVIWDEAYRVPSDVTGDDVCEYPLARNLVLLSVAIASETIVRFVLDGQRPNRSATLTDFAVHELER